MAELIYQLVANGVLIGASYAMASVGLTMIFGVLRAINFAHGEYYMFGAFASYAAMASFGLPYSGSILAAVAAAVLLGLLVSRTIMERLVDAPFQRAVLATLGVYLVLQNAVFLGFGGTYRTFPGGWLEVVEVFGVNGIQQRFVLIGVMAVVFVGLELMIRYTQLGRTIRAVAQNREACTVVGIDVERVTRITFCIGVALAALAGALMGPILVTIYPHMGEGLTFKAFAVTVIAGMGNVHGVVLSSLFLGMAESLVAGFAGSQYREAVGFVALIAVLMWRPYGVFTARGRF
jgi:branched-chain amino acid transport system permease protein